MTTPPCFVVKWAYLCCADLDISCNSLKTFCQLNSTPSPWWVGAGDHEFSIQILIFCSSPIKTLLWGNWCQPHCYSSEGRWWQTFFCVDLDILFIFQQNILREINPQLPTSNKGWWSGILDFCADLDVSFNTWQKNCVSVDSLTSIHTPMKGVGLAKMTFLCGSGYFIQFQTKKNFVIWH